MSKNLYFTAGLSVLGTAAVLYLTKRIMRKAKMKRPKMKLYWYDNFRSKRCEWLLAELGALNDVELVCMNPQNPDQDALASYRKVHPHGTIPCLEIEGRSPIVESGAICLYLADVYNKLGPSLDKEAYYNWLIYSVTTLDEVMETILVQWVFTQLEDQDNELINKLVLKFETFAKYLSNWLKDRDYVCGNRLTAADCVLGYNLWWANTMRDGVLLRNHPILQKYYSRLQRRSAFQLTFSDEEDRQF